VPVRQFTICDIDFVAVSQRSKYPFEWPVRTKLLLFDTAMELIDP
jgi:hypothetical protein